MKTAGKTTTKAQDAALRKALGGRRIDRMSWKTLARIYAAARPGSPVRKAVNAEAHRCGYTPSTILALNAE